MAAPPIEVAEADVLVLGGGLAGHRAATTARADGADVLHAYHGPGASQHVIGFNVPLGHADSRDNAQAYFEDIVAGGYGLNDRRLVQALVEGAAPAFEELVAIGVPFATDGDHYAQRHLSGNRYARSVFHPEGVGRLAVQALSQHGEKLGVRSLSGWKALALLRSGGEVVGALLMKLSSGALLAVHARSTVLALGGIGAIYADSTYPLDVAADSYALAWRAGATLIDMEFVQFEPTVVADPEGCRGMEMPTAMLGDGGHLRNALGERFMFRYNPEHGEKRIEKARMALCIQKEVDAGRGFPDRTVAFDTTQLPPERLESYVSHCRRLRRAGLDPAVQGPRVRPAAHSHMGGIRVDARCDTGVPGLFAAGEAAGGVHGASRLAGNGGSDVIVFGGIAGHAAAGEARGSGGARDWNPIHRQAIAALESAASATGSASSAELKGAVREAMREGAGLYRSRDSLETTLARLDAVDAAADRGFPVATPREALRVLELRNMALAARLIVRAGLAREESRGAHQRTDFPDRDDARWLCHVASDATDPNATTTAPIL